MRTWLFLLGGFVAWTLHFFGVYAASSLFPGSPIARWLTLAITAVAIAGAGWVCWRARILMQSTTTGEVNHWMAGLALAGGAVAGIAILYQGLPALLT